MQLHILGLFAPKSGGNNINRKKKKYFTPITIAVLVWLLYVIFIVCWATTKEPESTADYSTIEPITVVKYLTERVEVEVPGTPTPYYENVVNTTTQEEVELLYRIVYHEARGESRLGKRAVAEVVLNRVKNDRFPNTIFEVLNQKYQFVSTKTLWNMKIDEPEAYEDCKAAVQTVLYCQEPVLDDDVVYFMTSQTYGQHKRFERIGGHSFFYI